jgi:hypothetical protein
LGYIWHDSKENSKDRRCKYEGRYSDAEYHNPFADISDKK